VLRAEECSCRHSYSSETRLNPRTTYIYAYHPGKKGSTSKAYALFFGSRARFDHVPRSATFLTPVLRGCPSAVTGGLDRLSAVGCRPVEHVADQIIVFRVIEICDELIDRHTAAGRGFLLLFHADQSAKAGPFVKVAARSRMP